MQVMMENEEVAIIGAGICGLATAISLHRKGIKSVVFERSETLRNTTGTAILIRQNGMRALDQLGVADTLRQTATTVEREHEVWLDKGKQKEIPIVGESLCLSRKHLIDTLYAALPSGTVKFGRQLESIKLDPNTAKHVLRFIDGISIIAKVVIGCDGANSVVAHFLNLKPLKMFSFGVIRGLTRYPSHSFGHEMTRLMISDNVVGRSPINDNLVSWYCKQPCVIQTDERIWKDPEVLRQSTLDMIGDYPQEIKEMIEKADANSLSVAHLRYRAPWNLLTETYCKGSVTVAGDAMHVMAPFLGQGGSAGLEDAVVLARNMAQMGLDHNENGIKLTTKCVREAFELYVKQRRMRFFRLSLQGYLIGVLFGTPSRLRRLITIMLLGLLFRDPYGHIQYDCGGL